MNMLAAVKLLQIKMSVKCLAILFEISNAGKQSKFF